MGSYASIMNDSPLTAGELDLYVKFNAAPPQDMTVLSLVTEAPGVVAAVPVANATLQTDTTIVLDEDAASDALGIDPGSLALGPLLASVIGAASIDEGYSLVPRGDFIRTNQSEISQPVFVQWHLVSVNNNAVVVLFGGTKNLTTASMVNGDNRSPFLSQFLEQTGVDTRITNPIASSDPAATKLVDQYEAMVQSEDTSVFTTKSTAKSSVCSLMGMQLQALD